MLAARLVSNGVRTLLPEGRAANMDEQMDSMERGRTFVISIVASALCQSAEEGI